MSTTIIAVLVNLLATFLPLIGVDFDSEKLNTSIQTIVALITGIWIWIQRTKMTKVGTAGSDVTLAGTRKN